MVVDILVAECDRNNPLADQCRQRVDELPWIAAVAEACRHPLDQPDRPVRLAQQECPGIRRHRSAVECRHHVTTIEPFEFEDATARLWKVQTGRDFATMQGLEGSVHSVAFSPNCRTLATGYYNTVKLWEVATGRDFAILQGNQGALRIVLPPNSLGSSFRLPSPTSKSATSFVPIEYGLSITFSPDGRILATGSSDQTTQLWPVGQGLVDLACARVHDLPLLRGKQRFGIEHEWCTPEVSVGLRAKLGLEKPKASAAAHAADR